MIPAGSGPEYFPVLCVIARIREAELSFGAKLLYGRLSLYGRKSGVCNPSHAKLAGELGMSDRHIRKLLAELRTCGLVSWERTRSSSQYRVNQPEAFISRERNRNSDPNRNPSSTQAGTTVPTKRGLSKEIFLRDETANTKLIPANESERRDSLAVSLAGCVPDSQAWTGDELKMVRERLRAYMEDDDPPERFEQSCELRARGAKAGDVLELLDRRWQKRKYRPGRRHGPYKWNWFLTVIGKEFSETERDHLPEP
jgi:biotin operon repressor